MTLPTEPGYYTPAVDHNYGSVVVVELLASPKGQWVDAGDTRYLTEQTVLDMGPLIRLVPEMQRPSDYDLRVRECEAAERTAVALESLLKLGTQLGAWLRQRRTL